MSSQGHGYGVAVIGAGWVSGEHIKAFQKNPRTRIVGMYSRSSESARRKMDELGVTGKVYADFGEVLDDPSVQIMSICSPRTFMPTR